MQPLLTVTRRLALMALLLLSVLPSAVHAAAEDPCGDAYMLGYAALETKDYAAALPHFEQALALAKVEWRKGPCHYRIAECLEKLDKPAEATTHYAAAVRCRRDDRYKDEINRQRHIGAAFRELTHVKETPGKLAAVREAGEWILATFPDMNPNERTRTYEEIAKCYANTGDPKGAAAYLQDRIASDKFVTPDAAIKLELTAADLLNRGGLQAESLAVLTPLLARVEGSDAFNVHKSIAEILNRQGEKDAAVAQLRAGIARTDLNGNQQYELKQRLAAFLADQKKGDESRAVLKELMEAPDFDKRRLVQVYSLISDSYNKENKADEAIAAMQEAQQLPDLDANNQANVTWKLADLYKRYKQDAAAIATLKEGLKISGLNAGMKKRFEDRITELNTGK